MRIDSQYQPQPVIESDRRSGAPNTTNSAATRVQTGEDQAQFSGAHVQVAALAGQVAQMPEVREERVQSLREVVRSGAYVADPHKVAGALLAHMTAGPAA